MAEKADKKQVRLNRLSALLLVQKAPGAAEWATRTTIPNGWCGRLRTVPDFSVLFSTLADIATGAVVGGESQI